MRPLEPETTPRYGEQQKKSDPLMDSSQLNTLVDILQGAAGYNLLRLCPRGRQGTRKPAWGMEMSSNGIVRSHKVCMKNNAEFVRQRAPEYLLILVRFIPVALYASALRTSPRGLPRS